MSKKSYMNTKNILSESFFSKLKNKIADGLKTLAVANKNKDVMKDKKVKEAWAKVEKAHLKAQDSVKAFYKKHGLEYPG